MEPSKVKSGIVAIVPFPPDPNNILFIPKVVTPVPPYPIGKTPDEIDETFKTVKAVPEPEILVDVNVFVPDVHVKFPFPVIGFVPFPINKHPPVKLFPPVPPLVTTNVPYKLKIEINHWKDFCRLFW